MYCLYKVYHDYRRIDATEFGAVGVLYIRVAWDDALDLESESLRFVGEDAGGGRVAVFEGAVTDDP